MNLKELQKIIGDLGNPNILKNLKGQKVPISELEKVKLIDSNEGKFTFERNLTNDELSYFKEWLKDEKLKSLKEQLGL